VPSITLSDALSTASSYWAAKGPSSRMMSIRAQECAKPLGLRTPLSKLDKQHGAKVLTHLRNTGKSKGSIQAYYAAFKRAVELAGGDTKGWPRADTPPRKCREPLSEVDLDRLAYALRGYLHEEGGLGASTWATHDLLELLRGTGMRVEREALNGDAWTWDPEAKLLRITGKGGHQRVVPVERLLTIDLLNDPKRLRAMRKLSYSGHLKRWQLAVERLRITSLKPTPHAVRHYYATRAYERSGRNLRVVQELLGHSDINTTARYLGVDLDELRRAVA
jgi:site-specific recombinase XerD